MGKFLSLEKKKRKNFSVQIEKKGKKKKEAIHLETGRPTLGFMRLEEFLNCYIILWESKKPIWSYWHYWALTLTLYHSLDLILS